MTTSTKINNSDLMRIFWRCFFIQGSWNFKSMLGVGFAFAAIPIAQRLYKDKTAKEAFLARHLMFFNSHPYLASVCLGACAHLEEEAQNNNQTDQDKRKMTIFKEHLIGPLGALGDEIFWKSVKPFCSALAVLCGIMFGWIAIPVFLITYNIPHLVVRFKGLFLGNKLGFDIVNLLSMRRIEKFSRTFAIGGSLVTGLCIAAAAKWRLDISVTDLLVFSLGIMISFFLLNHKRTINFVLLIASLFTLIISYLLV